MNTLKINYKCLILKTDTKKKIEHTQEIAAQIDIP